MYYGILIGDNVVALTDMAHGRPIVETAVPYVREGYRVKECWRDDGATITHCYEVVPLEGPAEEAALALSRLQFASLPDNYAYEFRALADEYIDGMTCYGKDNAEGMPVTRVRFNGELYRFIGTGTQVMQPGWNPVDAPSLWAKILPGQEGSDVILGEWEQPDSTNGYKKGDRVIWNDHIWESTFDGANVWEPGTVGAPWTDLGEVGEFTESDEGKGA